jgi:peptidoglycan/xylan/chitin deacetylase (PgdA/CDA1 family)
MIRVRNDDVLRPSSDWKGREFERLKRIHSWISEFPKDFIHVPTILVNDIEQFPEAIDFVVQETAAGLMVPEVHGLDHVDYCNLPEQKIVDDLSKCIEWHDSKFGVKPTRFYTPWGGMNDKCYRAAQSVGLRAIAVDTNWSLENVCARLGKGGLVEDLHDREIFMHWWNRGIRLKRVAMAVKYGSWAAAKVAEESKEYF